jgi:hypothetical protein
MAPSLGGGYRDNLPALSVEIKNYHYFIYSFQKDVVAF